MSPVYRVNTSAAARHWLCSKDWLRLWRDAEQQLLSEGTWQWVARDGKRQQKEKPLTLGIFHVLPNIKLFSPSDRIASWVLSLPLNRNVYYQPGKGYEEQLQDTTKGSAPKSPPSAPLKKGGSLSCWYLSFDTHRS